MVVLLLPLLLPLLLSLGGVGSQGSLTYSDYRLEKLCLPGGGKVKLPLLHSPATFHLDSNLLPSRLFDCHIEFMLGSKKTGVFVYFDAMKISAPTDGECDTDYVQFGRDILFITSYRSNKFCGTISGKLPKGPPGNSSRRTEVVTPMARRVYIEASDQEMDMWIQLAVPPTDWPGHKTVSLTVTPFQKSCDKKDRNYRRCSPSHRYCIHKHLFCDGKINCALKTSSPVDEKSCAVTAAPKIEPSFWGDAGVLHYTGLLILLLGALVTSVYTIRRLHTCWGRVEEDEDRDKPALGDVGRGHDMGRQTRVARTAPPPPLPPPPLPPSYTDSLSHPPPFSPTSEGMVRPPLFSPTPESTTRPPPFSPTYSYGSR